MRHSWTQTIGFAVFILIAITLMTSCSKTITISGEPLDDFRKQAEQNYPDIEKMTLVFEPLNFRMTYVSKDPLDEKEKDKIFEDSRKFLMSDQFDKEITQSPQIAKYFSSGHPNFIIIFRSKNSDSATRFELRANNEKNADPVYTDWYYVEGDEVLGEPYATENK